MERKVTILSNKGTNTKVINTLATTRGELELDMTAAGINFEGMSFFEGISKTELMDSNSALPSNLTYKGQVTNDLVILLTVKDKKIASGLDRTRKEIYKEINENNFQDEISSIYNKSYTILPNTLLNEFLDNKMVVKESISELDLNVFQQTSFALILIIDELIESGMLSNTTYDKLNIIFGGDLKKIINIVNNSGVIKDDYEKEDLDKMFDFVK